MLSSCLALSSLLSSSLLTSLLPMRPSTVALLFVALLGLFHVATATSVSLEAVDPSCPPMAKYRVGLCKRLLPTMQQEGGIKLHFGQGEVICGIARFAYEDMRECSKVYDHVAEVGKAWDLVERLRGSTAEIFCIHALAEPVHGRAIISPRTERKCLGTKTPEDDKFDMESEVPEGYTGNVLEDPFNTDISYINNCRCACKNQFNPDNQGCKCNCNKKPPSTPSVKVPSTPPKSSLPTPLKPLPPPAVCKKGSYIYEFPYTQYLTNKGDVHVVASFELQRMRVYRGEKMLKEYKMSSSEVGIGSADGSLRSPSGRFTIAQLVGSGAKSGADFVNLKTNGKFSKKTDKAATQSRILVLDGDDTDNKNSKSRLIYIHGTNKVDALGHPASQGSFRLANKDVIDLFKRVKVGTKFFAIPKCAWPKPGTKATKKPKAKKPKAKKPKAKKPKAKKPKSKKPKAKKPKTKKPKKAKKPKSKKPKSKKPKSKKKDKKNKKPKKGSKKPKKGSKKPKKGKKGPKSPKQPKNAGKCPTVPGFPYSPATNVVVDYELQRLRLYQGANLVKEYVISSGVGGVGSKFSSSQSPAGAFVIHSKVGEGYPVGTDFVALKPTTKKSGPNDKAALQTRVITLQGLEAGNKNTLARMIYIHGTNKPQELGRPTSAGCIRLSNSDIIDLFGRIQVGTTFTAKARCAWAR